ncbi:MAG: bifunctional oligoribonuclease/PAP phosphatase NrnA [Candidatus Dadabacteria bacterium]|nr:MAG: bifunctional oligoribonuclease/PAP phosphatase NrnA [Candidatus Dadabacteria bacterium]
MIPSEDFRKVAHFLKNQQKVAILCHYNPDGDAVGASLALRLALKALGVDVALFNQSKIPKRFYFLSGAEEFQQSLSSDSFDCCIVCDCGELERIGESFVEFANGLDIVNIDHHHSNEQFGSFNLVDPTASSTSIIAYNLIDALGVEITPDIATCLLVGLTTDTGSFRFPNTDPTTFRAAADLMEKGADLSEICRNVYESKSLASVKLWAEALGNVQFQFDGKVAELVVSKEMLDRYGASLDDVEGLVEEGRNIENVDISVLYKQDEGLWRVSLRSSDTKHDLSKIATCFGGGGHKAAAAFRSSLALDELQAKLREKLQKEITC